jgi:TonB family protein
MFASKVGTTILASAGQALRVSQNLLDDKLISRPRLPYPKNARSRRASGTVNVEAIIGTDGSVFPLHIVNRDVYPSLGRAAVEYVAQHRYRPYTVSGQPRQVVTVFTVNFLFSQNNY